MFDPLPWIADVRGSWHERLEEISRRMLGIPYRLVMDVMLDWQKPEALWDYVRVDEVDCLTYVEQCLALTMLTYEQEPTEARLFELLCQLIFRKGMKQCAASRYRFVETEWLPSHPEIFTLITEQLQLPLKAESARIDKGGLLTKQIAEHTDPAYRAAYLEGCEQLAVIEQEIQYIPLAVLRNEVDRLALALQQHGPAPWVALVISHTPELAAKIGSAYLTTHLGFVILNQGELYFRHATLLEPRQVHELLLADYAKLRLDRKHEAGIGEHLGALGMAFVRLLPNRLNDDNAMV
jgi:hypothetical protein